MILYFYFTKYIVNKWDTGGMMVAALAKGKDRVWYTDNVLDGYPGTKRVREKMVDYMLEPMDV